MSEIAARWVTVYPKIAAGFSTEVNAAVAKGATSGSQALGVGMEQSVKSAAPRIGGVFKSAMAPILTLSAVAGITTFVKKSVDAFSQLEDATAAAGVIFGDSMGKITTQAETASRTLGISKQQVIDAATTFGTYGKAAGLAGDDLAKFSTDMTGLAADMASFKGKSPEQAIEAIGAALRGEAEPIRAFGVMLDDATLRAQAMKMGLISSVKEGLTPQQKALAAQAEIIRQTSDAQGDFARTADSTANTQKTLAAESANLSAEIGQKLAPAIVEAQKAGIGFLRFVSDNQAAIVPLVTTVGTLTLAIGGFVAVSKGIAALKSARVIITGIGDAFSAMGTKAKIATVSAGAIGIALAGAAVIYGAFAQKTAEAEKAIEDYTSALEADNGALGENVRLQVAKRLEEDGAIAAAQSLGLNVSQVTDAVMGNSTAMAELRARLMEGSGAQETSAIAAAEHLEASKKLTQILGDENTALQSSVDSFNRVAAASAETVSATEDGTGATKSNTGVMKTNTDAIKSNAEELNKLYQARLTLRGDKRALEAAIDGATESLKKNGKTLDTNTDKGRNNQDALDNIANSALAVKQAMEDQKKPTEDINKVMGRARTSFIDAATSMGMSKEKAEKLATSLGLIKSKKVTVEVDVKLKQDTFTLKFNSQRQGGPKLATGGPIIGPGSGTSDDVLIAASNGEWVIRERAASYYGPHVMDAINQGKVPRSVFAGKFASGGPVMPSYKGHSLDWWEQYVLSDLESTQLQIRIRDIQSDLKATETYNPPGKKKKATRQKLRGLDRTAAEQELAEANEKWRLAQEAAAGMIATQTATYKAATDQWQAAQDAAQVAKDKADAQALVTDPVTALWKSAASSLTKSGGISMDAIATQHTNALGERWSTSRAATAADLAAKVTEQANQVSTFIGLLDQLRKAGASEALISDVMGLGTVAGTKAAQLYLADQTQMAIANAGYAQLAAGSATLNTIAGQIAVTINESATPEATAQAVVNGILMART